ncbi:MAG TPA: alcohol dehydrogenase catalytic domain-containing protein [Candidatus Hydrogenedentes bacterium]|mgnify:CR=1 FL=1|nr:alcohol dehydrogenase catalytic domain-containing protein [Candidatus Hydrogenedentota bacterium]HOL75430.1 alcohol dehydrogenase catalytic domain-containing protein [Candidatus Hydrogenedentota bacterium]HPO84939.1 alcohol dehydrogenase catalytic domain-containing protein [Candidatus Hydrogenedentota bacterium]
MLAAVLKNPNTIELEEMPIPEVTSDSALLRVESVALCGSDLRILRHGNPRVKLPAIIGHEISGTIVKTGSAVSKFKEGQRVAIGADVPCGICKWCRNGMGNNCKINYAVGYQIPGGFAQYMLLPPLLLKEGPVTPFHNSLSFDEAALAEPLACAINGLEIVNMCLGKTVVIIGLGPIGCMMIDLARAMGAVKVIAVQRSRLRMEIAKTYGADVYIASEEEDVVKRCLEETEGEGPDIVLTTCGSVESHEQAIQMVAHRGYVNLFGGLGKDARPLSVLSNTIHYKECFVTGSHGSVPRHHELAVRLLERGRVRVKPLITHSFSLDRIHEAFEVMERREGMKIILHPNGQ